jgi:uroporphyrinogen decarboxylase
VRHRERVQMALHHEEPDRCPMQISFTPEFASRLKDSLGLSEAELHNPHGGGNSYVLERMLDEDPLLTSVGWANSYYATSQYSQDGETYIDEWGVRWKNTPYETRFGTGHYIEMVGHPLAADEALDCYRTPDPLRPELYLEAARVVREHQAEYWIVGVTGSASGARWTSSTPCPSERRPVWRTR